MRLPTILPATSPPSKPFPAADLPSWSDPGDSHASIRFHRPRAVLRPACCSCRGRHHRLLQAWRQGRLRPGPGNASAGSAAGPEPAQRHLRQQGADAGLGDLAGGAGGCGPGGGEHRFHHRRRQG
ncbi:hypothetical protein G6F32_016024 [Rhizopus arrhizus]|nr:hypothetical protein G6F32_016024 [Rhizopus arrhizus]